MADRQLIRATRLKAFWDLRDEQGDIVPPGEYEIRGRFYLYYDPIVSIRVTVAAPLD